MDLSTLKDIFLVTGSAGTAGLLLVKTGTWMKRRYDKGMNFLKQLEDLASQSESIKKMNTHADLIQKIYSEFQPNHGGSIRDSLNRIERRLSVNEEMNRTTLELMGVPFFIADKDGNYTYASNAFLRMIGRTMEEVLGNEWSSWLHPDDSIRVFERWQDAVEHERTFTDSYRFIKPDGHTVHVHCIAYHINAGKDPEGFVGTITETHKLS